MSPAITALALEESQNIQNKMSASRTHFFARKIHKLKKMLKPLFSRKARQPAPQPLEQTPEESLEDLQNAQNEALEARLAEDLAASRGVSGDAIQALVDGQVTLVVVNPGVEVIPAHFLSTTPGRFSWTFYSPDHDICSRGDQHPLSYSQTPEQQTPPSSPR